MGYKIVIAGYSQMLAAMIQGVIASGCEIAGVFRHEKVVYSPVELFFKDYLLPSTEYSYIKNLNLYEIRANSINSEQFRKELKRLQADILIVASWGERLKKETLSTPKVACINVHPSLLPKYRGPNPYLQVIKNMETTSGVTFHLMDENYDTGAILAQYEVPILPDDTGKILRSRTVMFAQHGICELLEQLEQGKITPKPQNEKEATYYPQVKLKDLMLNFSKSATEIYAQIRGICDWQSCYFLHKGHYFRVRKCRIIKKLIKQYKPGTVIAKNGNSIAVACAGGTAVELLYPQLYEKLFRPFSNLYLLFVMKNGDRLL